MNASFPTQPLHQVAIDDAELQAELVPHLVLPLNHKGGRTDDEHSSGTVPDNEFQNYHAHFDRFAEAHVVGDQEVHPGHLDGTDNGIELVVLDVDAASERRLDVLHVCRRSRPPPDGIKKGVEPLRIIETSGFRQGDLLDDSGARF